MNKKKNSYSTEFKHEAATLVITQGYGIVEAANAMEVSKSAVSLGTPIQAGETRCSAQRGTYPPRK